MAGAEAVSPKLDDEHVKSNETAALAVSSRICKEKADSECDTSEFLEPRMTVNEGETPGKIIEIPSRSVLPVSDHLCSPNEVQILSPVPGTSTNCENATSNCAKLLGTVLIESDLSELSGDPNINVFPVTDSVRSKFSSGIEGSDLVETCVQGTGIPADYVEGLAEKLCDFLSSDTCDVNERHTQGFGRTGDFNVNAAESYNTGSVFTELKSNSSEALKVSNTEIHVKEINNTSELFNHNKLQHITNHGSGSDLHNEPSVAEEVKNIAKHNNIDIQNENNVTELVISDDQTDTMNVERGEAGKTLNKVSASNEEDVLISINNIESVSNINGEDSTSMNVRSDMKNTNNHLISEHVSQYCTKNRSASVLKLLKPCTVVIEKLNRNVIDALKSISNSPSDRADLNIETYNEMEVVSVVKNEILTFDPADGSTSQNANTKVESVCEHIMKENKAKLQPQPPRTRKRKKKRTVYVSPSGAWTGSQSDKTVCNDVNKTAIHNNLETYQQEIHSFKQEPEKKKLKTVEDDIKYHEDSDVNCPSSASVAMLMDRFCNTREFKDILSADITSSLDNSSDCPVTSIKDPFPLVNKQITKQENSEDGSRDDYMETGHIRITASFSLCQNNNSLLTKNISVSGNDIQQETRATVLRHTGMLGVETTQEDVDKNQEEIQISECSSHKNSLDIKDELKLTLVRNNVNNQTKLGTKNDVSTCENKDPADFSRNGIPPHAHNFEKTAKENSVTEKELCGVTIIIPDKPQVAPIAETPEEQKPGFNSSVSSGANVANKRFCNMPLSQLQQRNRVKKTLGSKSNKQPKRKYTQRQAARKAETQIKVLAEQDSNFTEELVQQVSEDPTQMCLQCCRVCVCELRVMVNGVALSVCSEECIKAFQATEKDKVNNQRAQETAHQQRKCHQCQTVVTDSGNKLIWQVMEFCQEECLAKYQKDLGRFCCFCKCVVPSCSLGKYCVRFGFDIRQFCCSTCLEEFKKRHKLCSYCQKNISGGSEGFLAVVGDQGKFKEFCSQQCMVKYDYMSGSKKPPPEVHQCAVCNNDKLVTFEVVLNGVCNKVCSEPCFAAFKFVNRIVADQCTVCRKYFDLSKADNYMVHCDGIPCRFCCRTCLNMFILANRRIVPCNWCNANKYNFDMIKCTTAKGDPLLMCSLHCLAFYQYSVSAIPAKQMLCDMCSVFSRIQYHLAMSDSSIRYFCNYICAKKFQDHYKYSTGKTRRASAPVPMGSLKKATINTISASTSTNDLAPKKSPMPVILSVTSLTRPNPSAGMSLPTGNGVQAAGSILSDGVPVTAGKTISPGVQLVTKPQLVSQVSSVSMSTALPVTTRVSTGMNDLATKQSGAVNVPVPESELVSTEINKIGTMKQATSNLQDLPAVDKFAKNTSSTVLPVVSTVDTAIANSTVLARSAKSLAVDSNEFLGTSSPVDTVLSNIGNGPDISIAAQRNQSISMNPEKFLANPSAISEFPLENSIDLATGVPTVSSAIALSQQSSTQSSRVVSEEGPENVSPALACTISSGTATGECGKTAVSSVESDATIVRVVVKEVVCIEPETPPEMKNVSVLTKPILHSKGIVCRPNLQSQLTQTDVTQTKLPFVPIPIPVPIYVPCPVHMFASLIPIPMPFPLPIPVPTIIPTTKNTLEELLTEIKNIRDKLPENHSEAESLTMAEKDGKRDAPEPDVENQFDTEDTEAVDFTAKSGVPEKPDIYLTLNYTLCLKVWNFWVKNKNKHLELVTGAKYKPILINPDILQLTAEELNYALCLFVAEAKKPSGIDYTPDAVFYFCLGIQYYLYECGRVDNIFTDPYYIKFTDCLDKILQSFISKHVATDEIVTRVIEEHLWQSKQLGVHSPDVLLTTLIFFNTKYFNLFTVDDHMQLTFARIMKHWKRPSQESGGTSSAHLLFHPPASMTAIDVKTTKKKKMRKYEQQENEENPLRCPVKFYEFYVSKCPDSVKAHSDMFYLQPERSCVPDSPVWYTTTPLAKDILAKILNRLKIVKEINEAMYCS